MALGILGIIFAVLVLISALAIFALFFKGGYYVSNTWIFYLIQVNNYSKITTSNILKKQNTLF